MILLVGVCSNKVIQDSGAYICEKVLQKFTNSNANFDLVNKSSKSKPVCAWQKDVDDQQQRNAGFPRSWKNLKNSGKNFPGKLWKIF